MAQLAARLRELAADPLVREAVAVSSPSLAHTVERVRASGAQPPAGLRTAEIVRALRALAFYRLRMSGRPTPFGLMAGVSPAGLTGDPAEVRTRLGERHRRSVRPDRAWLTALVAEWERRPQILWRLRVVANNLCFVRNGRVVLPYAPDISTGKRPERALHEISVRCTAAVRVVMENARRPVLGADLVRRLEAAFPEAARSVVEKLLIQLVEKEVLLTELRPPLESADPLEHVLTVLTGAFGSGAEVTPEPAVMPELRQLRGVQRAVGDYAAQPIGQGEDAWRALADRMRQLCPAEHPAQVDLLLDGDIRLPRAVGEEAERAAALLWRLSPADEGTAVLRQYHADFLERYGQGRLVPVKEALDPDVGLGAPAGYRWPPSPRPQLPEPAVDGARARLLAGLAQEAMLSGEDEVVLTDDHPVVAGLASGEGTAPDSLDLIAQVLARSAKELADGRFQLVLRGVSSCAGAALGRFCFLLPQETQQALRQMVRSVGAVSEQAVLAQMSFQTSRARHANVTQVPCWLDELLPVAAYSDPGDPRNLDLNSLALCADQHRLFLVRGDTGQQVRPRMFHMLNASWNAPNAARLLCEIAYSAVRVWQPWNWGPADALPYLPRVRYGRTVLFEARWRPEAALCDQDAAFPRWVDAVDTWRRRWRVPDLVCLTYADQRTELDLTCRQHLALLKHELGRRPQAVLQESRLAECGWLTSAQGAHANEVVFPLVRRAGHEPGPAAPETATPPPAQSSRTAPSVHGRPHLPGGEWIYAALYCSTERHQEVLATQLPALLDTLPDEVDRWFFLRYLDQRLGPHLRLRLHADAPVLAVQVLPRLHSWTARMCARGLTHRLVLDTYEPELERYGGPEAIEAAERAFHADSRMAVAQLRLLDSGRLAVEPVLLAAANHVDLVSRFCSRPEDDVLTGPIRAPGTAAAPPAAPASEPTDDTAPWLSWMLAAYPRRQAEHREFQQRRRDALAIVDPYSGWTGLRELPGGAEVLRLWRERADAVTAYGEVLHKLAGPGGTPAQQVLPSLLHMHANRLLGIDPKAERASYAIACGALKAHLDRRRHGGAR